ncbi:helix-turn-helix domain-containing protein, partial [Shigella sonnei]|uniref:helix-turn-helix domain-containing protein n=1 Tax=Shigella sonnei TaxID=624 RepID=UPI001266818A
PSYTKSVSWHHYQKEREQIARLLANGESRKQIALIFDIGLSTLYRYFPASPAPSPKVP